DNRAALVTDRLAGSAVGHFRFGRESVGDALAIGDRQLTEHRTSSDLIAGNRPAAGQLRRPHRGRPGGPILGDQWKGARQHIASLVHRLVLFAASPRLIAGAPSRGGLIACAASAGSAAGAGSSCWSPAPESARCAVNARIVVPVHREQPRPLVFRAALAEHTANRMASAAERVRVLVGLVGEVNETTLGLELDGPRFFG